MYPPTILLISDDFDIEWSLGEAARNTGRTLNVARTAHDAVRAFAQGFEGLDLILVDLDPGMHGVTLFNALDDCHGKAPVVVLTAGEEFYMKPLAMSRGASECLGKPVTVSRFTRLFEEFCPSPGQSEPIE